MTKRRAEQELNPDNLDQFVPKVTTEHVATPEEIAARKIVKVSRGPAEPSTAKVNFIMQPLSGDKKDQPDYKPENPFLTKDDSSTKAQDGSRATPAPVSLFGNNLSQDSKSLFSDVLKTNQGASTTDNKDTQPDVTNNEQNKTQKKKQQVKPSLFNLSLPPGGTSLFSSLMSTPTPGGLFSSSGPSIFDFKSNTPQPTLFSALNNAKDDSAAEDDDGKDDEENHSDSQIDPDKAIMHYVYDNPYQKLIEKPLIKYKRDLEQVVENVYVTLEQFKENHKTWLFVRTKQTKTIVFQGQVVQKLSSIKVINSKPQNLSINVVAYEKEGKPKVASIKLQFTSEEDGIEFNKMVEGKLSKQK